MSKTPLTEGWSNFGHQVRHNFGGSLVAKQDKLVQFNVPLIHRSP